MEDVFSSITLAAADLKALGRLAVVPGLIATVVALMTPLLAFIPLTDSRPAVPWFGAVVWAGTATALGWLATRVRSGSTFTIGTAALTFPPLLLLLVAWRSRAGDPAIFVALTAFLVPTLLAVSSIWAFRVARRLHSRFPVRFLTPHATRRLTLPRDARSLRAMGHVLLGSLHLSFVLVGMLALAPLLRQGAVSVSISIFMPGALRQFRRVRAILALRAQEVRLEDPRLPVLLLRSFTDDELAVRRTKAFLNSVALTKLSLEEQIVTQLWEVGPVVAIGQPALEVDPIGAARERIVGPEWQPRVQALMQKSALVVVVLGQTEGLLWECEQLSRCDVSVLVILPPSDASVLVDRWRRFMAAYPPARSIVLEVASELPLLVWFRTHHEPLVVSGRPRDERSYGLAFALWRQEGWRS